MQTDLIDILPVLACSDIAAEHDFLVRVPGFASGGTPMKAYPQFNDRQLADLYAYMRTFKK